MASPNISLRESVESWRESSETQRLIDHEPLRADDSKIEPETPFATHGQPITHINMAPPPTIIHGTPIRLAPDADAANINHPESTILSPNPHVHPWRMPDLFEGGREENRSALSDIGRGFLIMFTAPLAFAGMGLYVSGLIIEGIAMVLKGIGLLGAKLLMRGNRRSRPPYPEHGCQWA